MTAIFFDESGWESTESFEEILRTARRVVEYLESRGLRPGQTRLGTYVKFYERFLAKECTENEIRENLSLVQREMDEWSWIHKGLMAKEPAGIQDLLREASGGVAFAKNESANTHARNIQLELRVGSYFLQAGFDISFAGLSDLEVDVDGMSVFVECKRLNSRRQVMKRAKEAARQLKRRYKASRRSSYGLCVMDVSRVIHPKQGIATGTNALVARDGIRDQIIGFDRENDTRAVFLRDKKLISVWLQALVPAVHREENVVATRFSSLHSVYALKGQTRWRLFERLRQAWDVDS